MAKWINAKYGTSNWRPVDLEVGFAIYGGGGGVGGGSIGGNRKNSIADKSLIDSYETKTPNNALKPRDLFVKYGSLNAINDSICRFGLKDHFKGEKITTTTASASSNNNDSMDLVSGQNMGAFEKRDHETLLFHAIYKNLHFTQRADNVENPLWFLSEQTIKENGQILIFTTDRASAESIASKLAFSMHNSKNFYNYLSTFDLKEIESNYISKMKSKDEKLVAAMINGVAFHHAGLDLQKRKLVEDAYKSGKIKILLSTTTLIAGVNLPATLVIFESLSFWNGVSKQMMTKRDFLNGCGRAGRPGLETRGRALIMASSITSAIQFISRPLEKVESQFTLDTLVFQTLSIIKRNADKGQKYTTIKDIDDFFRNSFYFSCGFKVDVRSYLKQLLNMDMISICRGPKQPSNDASNMPIGKGLDALREEPYNKNYNGKADIQSGAAFCITSLGYETIRFYLNPRTGFLIRNMLLASESYFSKTKFDSSGFFLRVGVPRKITALSFIHTLMHAREFQN
ncbi:MAG TPA: helicase-related protein, partial [Bacillales bacterium]|nr:helicase-related protein [Bacillales bacterium]